MKSGENWSSDLREEDVKRSHDFIHVYSAGARQINPGGQKFDCNYEVLL